MRLGAQTAIVLGTQQAVRDLLDKRAKIYSDRPELRVCAKHLSGGMCLLALISAHSSIPIISRIHHTYTDKHTQDTEHSSYAERHGTLTTGFNQQYYLRACPKSTNQSKTSKASHSSTPTTKSGRLLPAIPPLLNLTSFLPGVWQAPSHDARESAPVNRRPHAELRGGWCRGEIVGRMGWKSLR